MKSFEKDFKKWIRKQDFYPHQTNPASFKLLPESMQFGVYQDFFLENSMFVHIKQREGLYSVYIDWYGHHLFTGYIYKETLSEARRAALKKAINLYEG